MKRRLKMKMGKTNLIDVTTHLTPRMLGQRWFMHEESIRRKLRRRELQSVIIGRRRLIPISEIERVEAAGTVLTKS
jgi:hypothetical protein